MIACMLEIVFTLPLEGIEIITCLAKFLNGPRCRLPITHTGTNADAGLSMDRLDALLGPLGKRDRFIKHDDAVLYVT